MMIGNAITSAVILIQKLFKHKFAADHRSPILRFEFQQYTISLLPPLITLSFQVAVLLITQICFGLFISVITYYGIICSSSQQSKILVGFVVIPLVLYLPFPIIEWLGITATSLRLGLIASPLTLTLKCLEATFQYTPQYATTSFWDHAVHMAFLQYPLRDSKTGELVRATRSSIFKRFRNYFLQIILFGFLYSVLVPFDFAPFSSSRPDTDIFVTLEAGQLLNNLIAAVLVSLSLVFSMNGTALIIQILAGFQTSPVVDNPMFASMSPSDFWGKRWNSLIHRGLKQGVYKPIIAATGSKNLATMSAFLVSGLAHEYVWCVMFYASSHDSVHQYVPNPMFGKTMIFFGWNGNLLLFEHWVGREYWASLVKPIPRIVVSLVVCLMALPVGHLFTGDFRSGGYFNSLVTVFPLITIERSS